MDGIGEGSNGYGGDDALDRLLDEAGLNRSVAEIRALVEGVNAAQGEPIPMHGWACSTGNG